jgi:hypothetical protein
MASSHLRQLDWESDVAAEIYTPQDISKSTNRVVLKTSGQIGNFTEQQVLKKELALQTARFFTIKESVICRCHGSLLREGSRLIETHIME